MTEQEEKVEALAALVLKETRGQIAVEHPDSRWLADAETVEVNTGRAYIRIDRGPKRNRSGYLMIDIETGTIYGIKAYGVPNKRKVYGTLDTISDWYWGDYSPRRYIRPDLKA